MAKQKQKIFIADFETTTINTQFYKDTQDSKVFAWALWDLYGEDKFYGTSINEFIETIKEQKINICYFHNLSWDGAFIRAYLQQEGYTFANNEEQLKKQEYFFLSNNHKIYYIKAKIGQNVVKFKCSYLILSVSIGQLGKNFNLDKYENVENENFYDLEPVDTFDDLPKNFINYLKRDVEIMKLSLLNFETTLRKLDVSGKFNLHKYYTIARISFYFQSLYAKHWNNINNLQFFIKPYEYKEFKNLMSGGFSSFNISKQGQKIIDNIKGYDINSSYPATMAGLLPLNRVSKINNRSVKKENYIYFYKIKIHSAFSKNRDVLLMKNWKHKEFNTRYVNFIENVECWYFEEEWEVMKKHYEIKFSILETFEVKGDTYLKNYVESAYKMRLDNKEYKQSIKILLNSSFGFHAKKISYNNLVKDYTLGDKFIIQDKKNKFKPIEKVYEVFSENINSNGYETFYNAKLINEMALDTAPNIILASYITMKSRLNLINFMEKVGFDNCIYWDTDSTYFIDRDKDILKKIKSSLHETKLGKWKMENEIKEFYIKGSKSYYYKKTNDDKNGAYSGINNRWLQQNMKLETFENEEVLKLATMKKEYTKSGIVLILKDYKVNKRSY